MPPKSKPKPRRRAGKCAKCPPGKYQLSHIDNIPMFVCDSCGHEDIRWQQFYLNYMKIYRDKSRWDNAKDQVMCVLGFYCHMYQEHYQTPYVFVPKNPNPFGCKEIKDVWQLLSVFSKDAHRVRKYIYWFFTKYIHGRQIDITSLAYLTTPNIIRQYMLYTQKKSKITRSSALPASFLKQCKSQAPTIFDTYELSTYNDLGSLLNHQKTYNLDGVECIIISIATNMKLIVDGELNVV